MKREIYTTPVIEIIELELNDVLTASTLEFDRNGDLSGDADSWW